MELTKKDTAMTKGLAIIFMVMLHLFCRKTDLPYDSFIFIKDVPLLYYLGLFGDCCVVIYCFCSGYAHGTIFTKKNHGYKSIIKRLPAFIVRYWIIVLLISFAGLFTDSCSYIPGTIKTFLLNFFMVNISYNGAWWFVTAYILICFLSSIIFKITNKSTTISLLIFSIIYVVSYLYRFEYFTIPYPENLFFYNLSSLGAFGTSLLPYVIGIIFQKHKLFTKLKELKFKAGTKITCMAVVLLFVSMFVLHALFESLFFAIFTGIGTIVGFNIVNKTPFFEKVFLFFGQHSTNIWLTHMFFYMEPFEGLAFIPKNPALCFIFILILSLCSSYIIDFLYKALKKQKHLQKIL